MSSQLETKLIQHFERFVKKDAKIHNAFLLVHSDANQLHVNLAAGTTAGMPSNPDQPYYIASIGKLFASTMIGILYEKGLLAYEDRIIDYFDGDLLNRIHVYKGVDYSAKIQIKHLLDHSSGLHDYFEDKPAKGKKMLTLIEEMPDKIWTPTEIIEWSKEFLQSHFPPGEGFHYSDTGYHILGLLIERITGLPLHKAYQKFIFEPLDMHGSSLATPLEEYIKGDQPVAEVYLKNQEVTSYAVLKNDYAGGGIVSTPEDLLKFMKALKNGTIIESKTFDRMKNWSPHISLDWFGLEYGYGIVQIKAIPLVMPKKYQAWGNVGSIGSFMFYHPGTDAYLIGNLNHFRFHRKGIQLMLKTIDILIKESS